MSTSTALKVHDIENQAAAVESEPLLNQEEGGGDDENDGHHDSLNPTPEQRSRIGELPSVHKPGYGNWIWAEQQCARRSGFTVAEAKLVQDAQALYQDVEYPNDFIESLISEFVLIGEGLGYFGLEVPRSIQFLSRVERYSKAMNNLISSPQLTALR